MCPHAPPAPRSTRWPSSLALSALALLGAGCSRDEPAPTNVVLIVVDTLRADHVLDPEGRVNTPNLDALAADGVSFPLAFGHAPMTLPSHTALFSSRLPDETGVVINRQQVPRKIPLLAELLTSEGYATSAVVSIWTLGNRGGSFGIERGFEHYDRSYAGLLPPAPETEERLQPEVRRLAGGERPFLLFAHYSDPHLPYNVHDGSVDRRARVLLDDELVAELPISNMTLWEHEVEIPPGSHVFELRSEYPFRYDSDLDFDSGRLELLPPQAGDFVFGGRGAQTFRRIVTRWENGGDAPERLGVTLWLGEEPSHEEKRARYPGEVEFVDRYVGELLDQLKELGLYDDSLIVFTSDHGEALGEHDWWGHNKNLYDELLHVPLIVKLPRGHAGRDALEKAAAGIVSHIDLTPTILDLLGLPELPGQRGTSLIDPARPVDGSGPHFAATHLPLAESADGSGLRGEDLVALRDRHYKLIYSRTEDRFRMIDLEADPAELEDVFAEHGAERADWQARLRAAAAALESIDFESVLGGVSAEDRRSMSALGYAGSD